MAHTTAPTTDPTTHPDPPAGSGERPFPRAPLPRVARTGIVVAFVAIGFMTLGSLLRPFGVAPSDAEQLLDVIDDDPTRWAAAHMVFFTGGAALSAALVLLASWLGDRAPRGALVGGILGGIGGATVAGWAALQLCYLQLARLEPRATMVTAAEDIYASAALDATINLPGIGLSIGMVVLTVVARRLGLIGRGVAAALVTGSLLTFGGIGGIVGWPLVAAALAVAVRSSVPRNAVDRDRS